MHAHSHEVDVDLPGILDIPERPAPVLPKILEFDLTDKLPAAI